MPFSGTCLKDSGEGKSSREQIFKEYSSVLTEPGRRNDWTCDGVIIEVISVLCLIVWLNNDVSWKKRFGKLVTKIGGKRM